jgi:hypothetical protein
MVLDTLPHLFVARLGGSHEKDFFTGFGGKLLRVTALTTAGAAGYQRYNLSASF